MSNDTQNLKPKTRQKKSMALNEFFFLKKGTRVFVSVNKKNMLCRVRGLLGMHCLLSVISAHAFFFLSIKKHAFLEKGCPEGCYLEHCQYRYVKKRDLACRRGVNSNCILTA